MEAVTEVFLISPSLDPVVLVHSTLLPRCCPVSNSWEVGLPDMLLLR